MSLTLGLITSLLTAATPNVQMATAQQVRRADNAFWAAFSDCDRTRMDEALAPDVEFYHDKTGATVTRGAVVKSLMDGPCGTPGLHVRREAVAGSLSYDPIPGLGAISTGRHRFYARREGQAERLDGEARFAIVWKVSGTRVLIYRVLSYAHGAAVATATPAPADVPIAALQRHVGHYATPMGDIAVTMAGTRLHLVSGGLSADLVAITPTIFEAEGRPLRFEFVARADGLENVLVRENGFVVAEGERRDAR